MPDDTQVPTDFDLQDTPNSLSMAADAHEIGLSIDQGANILEMLTPGEMDALVRAGREITYAKGEYFFRQGDPHDGLHFIKSGRVRSFYVSPNGREMTLAYWPKGHFVGAPQIFGGGARIWSSVAVEPCVALWVPGASLKKLIHQMPNISFAIIEGLVHKSLFYSALLQIVGTVSKTNRLGHLLMTLAAPDPNRPNSAWIYQHFTHEELANMIGSTRQSISNSLEKFESQGLVERDGTSLRITDVHRLKALCE